LITILVEPAGAVSVIDIQTLGNNAFSVSTADGRTLKKLLAGGTIKNYFWDVRNDADALWAHHKVELKGVVDIQLLENASRIGRRSFVSGLQKAIQRDLVLGSR
jgi:exonuclease 3'-5' domain-containing protein 1